MTKAELGDAPTSADEPWLILVAGEDDGLRDAARDGLADCRCFGRGIELLHARSTREALDRVGAANVHRFPLVLLGVASEGDSATLELVSALRERFGATLQIVVSAPASVPPDEIARNYDISNYLARPEATAARLRCLATLAIRNYRTFRAVHHLSDVLSRFVTRFDQASTSDELDEILEGALDHCAAVWQFSYVLIDDLGDTAQTVSEESWKQSASQQLRALRLGEHPSGALRRLRWDGTGGLWGCLVSPVGRRFVAGFALWRSAPPGHTLLREMRVLLRSWALSRESLELRRLAAEKRRIREQVHRERRESMAQMVAGVAHEVNTPLGVANSAATTLQEIFTSGAFQRLAESQEFRQDHDDVQESVRLIRRNIERADELIRNFRKLSVGQLVDKREELDLLACVEDVVQMWKPEAKRARIELRIHDELDPAVTRWMGYAGFLSQVLLNLLGNAKRYAFEEGRGGSIDITVKSELTADRAVFTLVFRDDGKGIPPEDLPHIFETFFTTGRAIGGTGLGLSIVQNIVDSVFRGSIDCESTPGEGTTFVTTFSHCADDASLALDDPADDDLQRRLGAVERFIELQHKLAVGYLLSAAEQAELHDLTHEVDRYMAERAGGHERRQATRIPLAKKVSVWIDGSDEPVEMEIRDLSATGAGHLHTEKLEPGTRLKTRYWDDPRIVLEGKVVSCREVWFPDADRETWELGVSLFLANEEERRSLKLVLAQLLVR